MGSICSLKRATRVLASFLGTADSSSSTSVWQNVQRIVPERDREEREIERGDREERERVIGRR
jgi:hypothetical protein